MSSSLGGGKARAFVLIRRNTPQEGEGDQRRNSKEKNRTSEAHTGMENSAITKRDFYQRKETGGKSRAECMVWRGDILLLEKEKKKKKKF